MDDIPVPVPTMPQKFVDMFRDDLRARGYAYPTEKTYLHWIKRYIFFHKYKHPETMGKNQIEEFLNNLAVHRHVSPNTQRIALNALMYLYTKYLGREPEELTFIRVLFIDTLNWQCPKPIFKNPSDHILFAIVLQHDYYKTDMTYALSKNCWGTLMSEQLRSTHTF